SPALLALLRPGIGPGEGGLVTIIGAHRHTAWRRRMMVRLGRAGRTLRRGNRPGRPATIRWRVLWRRWLGPLGEARFAGLRGAVAMRSLAEREMQPTALIAVCRSLGHRSLGRRSLGRRSL